MGDRAFEAQSNQTNAVKRPALTSARGQKRQRGKHQGERHTDGVAGGQTGARELRVDGTALARKDLAGGVEAVEVASELLGKVRQAERGRDREHSYR